jgi:hypothetical protein
MRLLYINHIENDSIYLDLDIKVTKLAEVKFVGVRIKQVIKDNKHGTNKVVNEKFYYYHILRINIKGHLLIPKSILI